MKKKLLKGEADITPEKEKAHQLYKEGKSYREIARIIGKSDKTIKKWIEEYEEYCAKHEANEEVENDFFEVDSAEMRSAE
ncbi:helix-turn-helix domain-containing protein [Bacteroides fragilis]